MGERVVARWAVLPEVDSAWLVEVEVEVEVDEASGFVAGSEALD